MRMKHKNLLYALALPLAISFSGCDTEEVCEENNTGTLTLKNTRSSPITVNVAGDSQTISSGKTATFSNVPDGTCFVDVTIGGTTYTDVVLSQCVWKCETSNLQY